jgi:hypothetical protein
MSSGIEDLLAAYEALHDLTGEGDIYSAQPIHGRPSYKVAKDPNGNAALLISLANAESERTTPPVELRNLSFRPRCACKVTSGGRPETIETLAVLKCSTEDITLREYFLRALSGTLAALPPSSPTETDVAAAVSKLVELFRCLEEPPQASIQGLWCELFLIAHAPAVHLAAKAWHKEPRELYDFSFGEQRVEVKSTTTSHRVHEFLLEQLLPPVGTRVVVASFMIQESTSGLSVRDLWENIESSADFPAELRERFSRVISLSLGRDWREAHQIAFDPVSALRQMHLYEASVVPKVDRSYPPEVTDVRFKCDLSTVTPIARSKVAKQGQLFNGMFG